jgi:hypothetical protein
MKRLVVAAIVMGLVTGGLWMANACFAQGPDGMVACSVGCGGVWGGAPASVYLADDDDPNTPSDPNEPVPSGDE